MIYKIYLIGFLLVASHNIDNLILYGFDPFPIIITLPYVILALIWKRVHKVAVTLILGIFTVIELNHTFSEHLPNLFKMGLTRQTFSALLYDLGLIFWVGTILLLVKEIITLFKQRTQKNTSITK